MCLWHHDAMNTLTSHKSTRSRDVKSILLHKGFELVGHSSVSAFLVYLDQSVWGNSQGRVWHRVVGALCLIYLKKIVFRSSWFCAPDRVCGPISLVFLRSCCPAILTVSYSIIPKWYDPSGHVSNQLCHVLHCSIIMPLHTIQITRFFK